MGDAAKALLINAGTNRQGATVPLPRTNEEIVGLNELRKLGYVGKGDGLTRRGTIKRQILVEDTLNELFG